MWGGGVQRRELHSLGEQVCFPEALITDVEQQRLAERNHSETSREVKVLPHLRMGTSLAAGEESLRAGGRHSRKEGTNPLGGNPFFRQQAHMQSH